MKAITEIIADRAATSELPISTLAITAAYPTVSAAGTLESLADLVESGLVELYTVGPVTAVRLTDRGVWHAQECKRIEAMRVGCKRCDGTGLIMHAKHTEFCGCN